MAVERGLGPVVENDTDGLYVCVEREDGECKIFGMDEWLELRLEPKPGDDIRAIRGFSRMCRWVNRRVRVCPPPTIDEKRIDLLLASVQRRIDSTDEESKFDALLDLVRDLS